MKNWENDIIDKTELVTVNHDESLFCDLHTHSFYEIEYVCKGSVIQTINGVRYDGKKGDAFFMTPGDTHSFEKSQNYDSLNFLVHPLMIARFRSKFSRIDLKSIHKKIHLSYFEMTNFENNLHNIENELLMKKIGYVDVVQNYALIVFNLLQRYSSRAAEATEEEKNFDLLFKYIEDNYNTVTPKELAEVFFYNQNYLCKIFKERTQQTMTQYINQKKINHAMQLLKTSKNSVEAIGDSVGIPDKKYFYKLFKAQTGLTPMQFRSSAPPANAD